MYVQQPATIGATATVPAGQTVALPRALNQPQGDVYTSANPNELARKRATDKMNILFDVGAGGFIAFLLKSAGKNKLALGTLLALPVIGAGLRAVGGFFDAEWDKKYPPNSKNQAILHEVLRPSGIVELLYIAGGLLTLRRNVSGIRQGGDQRLNGVLGMDFLLFLPGPWNRYKEGQEKFVASGRGK